MAQQTVNLGSAPDDGTGDTLRVGGDKINDNFTELYTDYLPKAGGTLTGDLVVPDEAYDATAWNGSLEVPTKNAVRDKIESLGSGITELDDIPDVNAPTPTNGDVLTWDSTPGEWVSQPLPGAGAFALGDATDCDTAGQTSGDVLTYDGAEWVPQAPSGGLAACPAIRSSNLTKYASAASFSHSLPSGAAAGDFCLIFFSGGFGATGITSPAKSLWDTYLHAATNWNGAYFTRVLTAADVSAGSVTITAAGSFDAVVGAVCFTGEAKLRFPIADLSARSIAVHAPAAGATSSTQETAYASADDCIVTFMSNRASSTDTSDHGSQLQTTTNANGSGALYANEAPSAGGQLANLAYSTAGTGRYEIMLVVRGPN